MPAKSKAQQKFMGMVYGLKKGEVPSSDVSTKVKKAASSISKSDAEKFASTKHKGKPEHVKKETMVRELIRKLVREVMVEMTEKVNEAKKRDYKAEYKKFQSSDKSKKYRAELNAYNRKKGTYGNGDGKDASHKGGKIAGFEAESKNRGRAEKSRLKKEEKLTEKSAISLNLWVKEFERLAKKNKMNPVDFVKKHIEKRKGMDNEVVKNVLKHFQKNEGKLKEGFDLKKLEYAIKMFQQKIKKQGRVTNARDEQHLKQLIKVYKDMGGRKIKEVKLNEAKETIFDVAARVMKDKQNQNYKSKVGMVKVDMQSANLLVKVWKKINPKMKKILSDLGYTNPAGLMKTLWAVVK